MYHNNHHLILKRIITVAVVGIIITIVSFPFVYTSCVFKWQYSIENFSEFEDNFSAIASFCDEYAKSIYVNNTSVHVLLDYYDYSLHCDGDLVSLTDELKCSLNAVSNAFSHKDAYFNVIKCYNDSIWFCTNNGLYAVVYSPNQKPISNGLRNDSDDLSFKKASDDWYHVVANFH